MKFLKISALFVMIVGLSSAQWQNCFNRMWFPSCVPPGNRGNPGRGCPAPVVLWYYDRGLRDCRSMLYMGCGGNNNRWCSRAACVRSCRHF